MRCDRLLSTSMLYPGNYGYVPRTLSGDDDPLDILLVCDYSIYPGTVISVKVIGVLLTTDEKGADEKLIAVPAYEVDQSYEDINNYSDLCKSMTKRIYHFFEHYKDIDANKWVKVGGFKEATIAHDIFEKSILTYITNYGKFKNKTTTATATATATVTATATATDIDIGIFKSKILQTSNYCKL